MHPKAKILMMENPKPAAKLFARRPTFFAKTKLDVPDKVTHAAFQGFGKSNECFKSDFLFGAFNVANVVPCQIGPFRQLFLAPSGFLSSGANGFPYDAINSA